MGGAIIGNITFGLNIKFWKKALFAVIGSGLFVIVLHYLLR